jgi:hypothetical protein
VQLMDWDICPERYGKPQRALLLGPSEKAGWVANWFCSTERKRISFELLTPSPTKAGCCG